jgi:hypothetical protein
VEVMMLTGGAQCQRAGEGTGSGKGKWATGSILIWAEPFSPGPVSFFSLLCFFSFSVFLISFIDFAKMFQITSNHFQRFLQNSLQGFKSIGNKFSKSKQDF